MLERAPALFVYVLVALGAAGLLVTSLQALLTVLLLRTRSSVSSASMSNGQESMFDPNAKVDYSRPRVSILKPVCGLEDGLEQNLASFAALTGISYEVIISIARWDDPALEVVERVRRRFPLAPFQLVIGGIHSSGVSNPKVERLIAAAARASGDIFFISDSNVRVNPEDVAQTVRHFEDPAVGCVSNPFIGQGARTTGASIESLYLLTFVIPGSALANWFGVPCVVGKSMAIKRDLCERIGGFEAFLNRLAEDQAIGLAAKLAGYKVVLSPIVVRNMIERRTIGAALAREIRWGKLRFSFSKSCYTAEFLVNPFPLTLLAWVLSGFSLEISSWLSAFMGVVLTSRLLQAKVLAVATGARLSLAQMALVPVQDILQAAAQLVPYWSREVTWRGHRRRLGHGTEILTPAHYDTAAAAGRQNAAA